MRRALIWLISLAMLVSAAGCYHYVPVQVTLRDALTGSPVAGATVQSDYPRFLELGAARGETVSTDQSGQATLPIAVNPRSGKACLYFPSLYLDQPMPSAVVDLPLKEYSRIRDGARREHRQLTPIPLTVNVLSLEEYRRKYEAQSGSAEATDATEPVRRHDPIVP